MIANAYTYFKERNLCLGSAVEVTALCLGISKNSVLQYKDEPQKIKRRRSKHSTTDLGPNIKQEIRFVLYDMVHQSKREERVLYSMRFFVLNL
ncbi:unnamed protein product [Tenebrio molitor]|nr:unnamed protein product [Tenebrio molitor]